MGNATAGLLGRKAVATAIERVIHSPQVIRLTRIPRSAEGQADIAHTRLYTTGPTLEMELGLRGMMAGIAAETGHGLPAQAIEQELATLLDQGYPLSGEQTEAIRTVAGSQGRVAIIEGAAGSGKTTTLRPLPISTASTAEASSPPPWPGGPRWPSATTSTPVPSASTSS